MAGSFSFKRFSLSNERAALKIGTDAVLLGAAMTLRQTDLRLLDIGTGTGVIALMAAQRLSDIGVNPFRIEAIEIDGPSADEAAQNFAASPWAEKLHSIHVALKDFEASGHFDCIFSNPPFYDNSLTNPDAREAAARHTDSLSYREICAFASRNLQDDGHLSLILPAESEKSLIRTAASFGLFPFRLLRIRTTPTKSFRRIIAEFSLYRGICEEEELTLQEGQSRSREYTALTEEFYLDRF